MIFLIGLLSSLAAAQDGTTLTGGTEPSVNTQFFRPTVDGQRTLWTDDSMRGGNLKGLFRALFSYTHEPLVYTPAGADPGPDTTLSLVTHVAQADLMGAFSVGRLRIGADIPVYLFSQGKDAADGSGQTGLGDIGVDAKVTLLDNDRQPLGLALQGRLNIPSATVNTALGAKNTGWEASLIVDKPIGKLLLAGNIGVRGAPRIALENVTLNDYLVGRAALSYGFTPDYGLAVEAQGQHPLTRKWTTDGRNVNSPGAPVELMLSGYARPVGGLMLRLGGGAGLTPGIGAPDFRLMLGLGYEPGVTQKVKDTDGDGLADKVDGCPTVPEDFDNVLDTDGCVDDPAAVKVRVVDPQGNVIPGATVNYPAAGVQQSLKGGENTVALEPGGYAFTATAPGFDPGGAELLVAETDTTGEVTIRLSPPPRGTLQVIAKDGAGGAVPGVTIRVDAKPQGEGSSYSGVLPPGTHRVLVEAPGYKPYVEEVTIVANQTEVVEVVFQKAKAELVGDRIDIKDSVYFDTAKDTIKSISFDLLNEVVGILKEHPELTKIRIEGHTDSRGSDSYNLDLSNRRAASVRTYLIEHGIAPDRLESQGYGETKPIDAREIAEAWEKNRRVDFFVVSRSD